jgi:hypothetical protein
MASGIGIVEGTRQNLTVEEHIKVRESAEFPLPRGADSRFGAKLRRLSRVITT